MDPVELERFIVQAKAATYVGGGRKSPSSRPLSHDLHFQQGDWSYMDSYFGGRDFLGQEVVFHSNRPVWGMNYYGCILRPDLITPSQAGGVIQESLSRLYAEGRFLGGFRHIHETFEYLDASRGDVLRFTGKESISREGLAAYELHYHGGQILEE